MTTCALSLAASLAAALVGAGTLAGLRTIAGAVLGAAALVPGSIGRAPVLAFLGLFTLRVGLAAADQLSATPGNASPRAVQVLLPADNHR